jgi:hypothetical protein
MFRKSSFLSGAAIGLLVYLIFALVPSLVWGGYAGTLLAKDFLAAPARSTLAGQVLTVMGTVLGAAGVCALFMVAGAFVGVGLNSVVSARRHPIQQGQSGRKP